MGMKNNQKKQRHDPDDNDPSNTARDLDVVDLYPNDFISRLPDDILDQIVSLLPFQSAVRTTFRSTQWKDFWKEALLASVHDVVTMEDAVNKNPQGHLFASLSRQVPIRDAMLDFRQGNDHLGVPYLSGKSVIRLSELTELWWIDCSMDTDNVNSLLVFLKLSPRLERLYVTIDPESYNIRSTNKFTVKLNEIKKHDHLKLLKLERFAKEKDEILLAKELEPLFKMNPQILAKSKGACLRRLKKWKHKF
ncbi:F-box domain - like 10 [Theobroma cacao]|nr:F-box domain - like 10 [Theobroma cacao]